MHKKYKPSCKNAFVDLKTKQNKTTSKSSEIKELEQAV